MKLLIAIVRDDYAADVSFALNNEGFSITRVSSTGGFWRRGNVTLLIGVDDHKIDEVLELIDQHAGPAVDAENTPASHPPHRATVFVLGIDDSVHY